MSSTGSQRLEVRLTRTPHISCADRTEGHQVDRVNLDVRLPDGISSTHLGLGALPQAKRHGYLSRNHPIAEFFAEFHFDLLRHADARSFAQFRRLVTDV